MAQTPNVAIVLCDTLRRDVLDVYGGPVSTARLLRALGENTVTYLGYSNSFWTVPSHFSLFTGMPVGKHGLHEAPDMNRVRDVMELGSQYSGTTLAWELRKLGYDTTGISNNILVSRLSGLDRGFKTFITNSSWVLDAPNIAYHEQELLEELAARYRGGLRHLRAFLGLARENGLGEALSTARLYARVSLLRAVSPFIADKGHVDAIDAARWLLGPEPFFLFINLMEAHEPYYFGDPNQILLLLKDRSKSVLRARRKIGEQLKGYLRATQICVMAAAAIARLIREKGLLQRTLFILTSDHGQEFMEHGALGHDSGHLYEEDVGVPIIVKPPEGLKLSPSGCYVGLHELYNLALSAASGEKEWTPSCGPGLAESYDGVFPDPEAGKGVRRVAVFEGDRKVAYRLDGGDWLVEEVVVGGRRLDPRSGETKKIAEELAPALPR